MGPATSYNFEPDDLEDFEPHRSKRPMKVSTVGPDFFIYMNESISYHQVMQSLDAAFQREDINSDIKFILANHTWELVDHPSETKYLDYKWIFKKK